MASQSTVASTTASTSFDSSQCDRPEDVAAIESDFLAARSTYESPTRPQTPSTPRRSGRQRVDKNYALRSYRGPRSTNSITPSKSDGMERRQSERQRIREEIASTTKPRRDAFLHHYSWLFDHIVPESNYLDSLKLEVIDRAIIEHEAVTQPQGITATLKAHQLEGLSFLVKMFRNGMPAILGDEMGLGKTLQTLSLFQWLVENAPTVGGPRPFLVVCPLSVLTSWQSEAKFWCPKLNVVRFYGSKRRKQQIKDGIKITRLDICLTTYEAFVADRFWFRQVFVWRYIVLDEGHRLKNSASNVSSALQGLSAEYRLLITGTPLQNDMAEMWSLLHWLLPEVFTMDTQRPFKHAFNLSAGKASTVFMDHTRRLLEVLMIRRMKSSAGVNLDLPPKEQIMLYVPLTEEQRKWYLTLLTGIDQETFNHLFEDFGKKEQDHDGQQLAAHDAKQDMDHVLWQELRNLIIQLRKICTHPYLIEGVAPEVPAFDEKLRESSGKFIVLDKIIEELVMRQRKKVIIFSELKTTLDLCERLLMLRGANSSSNELQPFKYTRLDGDTSRARRNLSMRLFNDVSSNFRVMLISTRAGGLGITLVSASDVVFMDSDWNPQVTLQAEARAHRIGQTKKVTVYTLCSQGTVEEQMLSRIRKKLYLSAKITESMKNLHTSDIKGKNRIASEEEDDVDGPELGISQMMSLLRRGSRILAAPNIDATQLAQWDWQTMLENCKENATDAQVEVDEQTWLNQIERVETAMFEGRKHHLSPVKRAVVNTELVRADRRVGKNVTVMHEGYSVSKQSLLCGDFEAVPTLAKKDADPGKEEEFPLERRGHQGICQICWDGGDLLCCFSCPRAYHVECLEERFEKRAMGRLFYCPQHECSDCEKNTGDAGGLIYRCRWCERGFCEECLDFDNVMLLDETLPEFEMLGHKDNNAWFVECHECIAEWSQDQSAKTHMMVRKLEIEQRWALHLMGKQELEFQLVFDDGIKSSAAA